MTIRRLLIIPYIGILSGCFSACASEQSRGGMSFENLDANGDAKISLQEFSDKTEARRRSPEDIFNRLDINGDGFIQQDEFDARPNRRRGR